MVSRQPNPPAGVYPASMRPSKRSEVFAAAFPGRAKPMEQAMLGWALTFLVVALIAALFGFGGIAGAAVGIAKIIFFIAIILFLISAIAGAMRGRSV